jgi:ribosome biogenesis GTPase
MGEPRKVRIEFRKNRSVRRRPGDLTRAFQADLEEGIDHPAGERISGKGELTRKRTVRTGDTPRHEIDGLAVAPEGRVTWRGQVLNVHGLETFVAEGTGRVVRCTTSRVLRSLFTDQRHPVAAGDWVRVSGDGETGVIQAVEPRHSSLCRDSRGRRHVIVANVDQVFIVGSAAQPDLKPALIDRLIVAAESAGMRPVVCLNKADLVPAARLVPLAGVFARMGYPVVICSTRTGVGLERLRAELRDRVTAVVGQSGVGKSSLLNALDPGLTLPVAEVSRENEKGRHTTTTARLIPHRFGGTFVDTPGVRQFALWQTVPAEVPSAFRDIRPLANLCRFPDCTHTHESGCAVKDAVADGLLDTRRWESCRQLAGSDAASGGDDDAAEWPVEGEA